MHLSLQRIAADLKMCKEQNLDTIDGIYLSPDPKNPYVVYIMIIGPQDTPYQNGYYFFHLTFPGNYPFAPPVVKLMTQGHWVRFNPNFYVNGKVCISILNTWKGPQWTSCLNLKQIVLSLQSLMNNNPLINEPGWEVNPNRIQHKVYKSIITNENIRTAILGMITTPPKGFEIFLPVMSNLFIENYNAINDLMTKLSQAGTKKDYTCTVYNMTTRYNYTDIRLLLNKLYNKLTIDNNTLSSSKENNTTQTQSAVAEANKQKKRRVPNQNAKEFYFNEGSDATLAYNGHIFSVYTDKIGHFRWRKQPTNTA